MLNRNHLMALFVFCSVLLIVGCDDSSDESRDSITLSDPGANPPIDTVGGSGGAAGNGNNGDNNGNAGNGNNGDNNGNAGNGNNGDNNGNAGNGNNGDNNGNAGNNNGNNNGNAGNNNGNNNGNAGNNNGNNNGGGEICENTCQYAGDGECDDGGPNAMFNECPLGTDCEDCGPRAAALAGEGEIGIPCAGQADCSGPGAQCIPEENDFPGGYCVQFGCSEQQACPAGSQCYETQEDTVCLATCQDSGDCREGYACQDYGACMPGCTEGTCPDGQICGDEGLCVDPPCTPNSCPNGTICAQSGRCVSDVGDVPAGPVPDCGGDDSWQCVGGSAHCRTLNPFEPIEGPGYWNYPLNGETFADQYRSYARNDLILLIKHAAAKVDCLSEGWNFGNGEPLGLGDMSEGNGAIPGTREGQPGHPAGTHVDGSDMDIAYYQMTSVDNRLRPICEHRSGGQDQYHCTQAPDNFDVWRTALFLGFLHDATNLRVIGVDGQAGVMINSALDQLCDANWISGRACGNNRAITYEVTDMGRGWFRFHHHHFHISLGAAENRNGLRFSADQQCLTPNCANVPTFKNNPHRLMHGVEHDRIRIRFPH